MIEVLTEPAVLALLGTIFGGAGLKIIESFLNRNKIKVDVATQIREELRTEVTTLRTELKHVEDELDEWKGKYYSLLDEFAKFKQEVMLGLDAKRDK